MDDKLQIYKDKMDKVLTSLVEYLRNIRIGKANVFVLDNIFVDYFGKKTAIKYVASIAVVDNKTINITPWDINILKEIEKEILKANINLTPINDGKSIKIIFPDVTGETRNSYVKDIKKYSENIKISIRNIRRDGNTNIKKLKSSLSDDEIADLQDNLQKLTDEYIKKIDDIVKKKSLEIMSI